MRNLKLTRWPIYVIVVLFMISCIDNQKIQPIEKSQEISDLVKSQFIQLGFDVSDIQTDMHIDPITGESKQVYVLEGDIMISHDRMLEMLSAHFDGPKSEQYRTTNLVTTPRVIRVLGFQQTNSSASLNPIMRTALSRAVENYNNLALDITFTLSFGSNTANVDIVVRSVAGAGGGRAGFPTANGDPFNSVEIQSGTTNFRRDVVEHVMTHELGHCVGFRHTDFFNRSISCGGSPINEGQAGVGAIHIPGTPTGADRRSIMLSCFNSRVDGEFSCDDIEALAFLYDNTPSQGSTISASRTSLDFENSGGVRRISISSNLQEWEVYSDESWIDISPQCGRYNQEITVSARRNGGCEGEVIIEGGAIDFVIDISMDPPRGEDCDE